MDVKEVVFEGRSVSGRAFVYTVMDLRVPYMRETFVTS